MKTNENEMIYRQGDVGLVKIRVLPTGLKQKKNKILALGEATGHMHKFLGDSDVIVMEDNNNNLFLDVKSKTPLYHGTDFQILNEIEAPERIIHSETDTHSKTEIDTGLYSVIIENDYNPYLDLEIRARD